MKKAMTMMMMLAVLTAMLAGCSTQSAAAPITVISREDGSGTRGAFVELMGVINENDEDMTTQTAEITNSTSVMMTTVAGNKNAIGYVSLGSLDASVKAVKVDGVEASVENIISGSYKVSRPFNIATKEGLSDLAQDFIQYILSQEGQAVIESKGYISVGAAQSYAASGMSGKITLAGSTSVAPVMEVLAEEYKKLNPDVEIEIQQSGSSAGMTSAIEGVCDIGMASRELKQSELDAGLTPTVIALDGIAVIVNQENAVDNLTSDQIAAIYLGQTTSWGDVQ